MNKLTPDKKVVATDLAVYALGEFIYKDCSRESIKQVMMWPDLPKFQKPRQVCYYQTKVPEFKKNGIAVSAEKRAKTGKRSGWYEEQLQYLIAQIGLKHLRLNLSWASILQR